MLPAHGPGRVVTRRTGRTSGPPRVTFRPWRIAQHRVTGVDHVGIAVADLDEAIAWYADTFGLVATHAETNEEQGVREAMLSAPGDAGATRSSCSPRCARTRRSASSSTATGPGIQQMAYRVVDIDATCAALREQGVRLLYDEPRRGTAGSRINFVHPKDAGGVLVELVEPAARRTDRPTDDRLRWRGGVRSQPIRSDRSPRLPYCRSNVLGYQATTRASGGRAVQEILDAILAEQFDAARRARRCPTTTAASPCTPTRRRCSRASPPRTRTRARACTSTTCRRPSSARARRSSR